MKEVRVRRFGENDDYEVMLVEVITCGDERIDYVIASDRGPWKRVMYSFENMKEVLSS
jgi:hypothetical protein